MAGHGRIARALPALVVTTVCAVALPARGIGICEDTPSTWRIVDVAEQTGQLVVEGEVGWCEEDEEGGETRGTLKAARILDASGATVRWFAEATDEQSRGRLGAGEDLQPMKALGAARKAGGFVPAASLRKSPSGRCAWREALGQPEGEGAQEQAAVSVDLLLDGKAVSNQRVGSAATGEARQVEVAFLPARRAVLVAWVLPVCDGGPPAGMFGDDDPGECYVSWQAGSRLVEAAGTPLEACFAPQGAGPALTPVQAQTAGLKAASTQGLRLEVTPAALRLLRGAEPLGEPIPVTSTTIPLPGLREALDGARQNAVLGDAPGPLAVALAPDVPAGLLNAVVHGAASAGFDGVDLLLARGGGTVALPVRFPRICGPSDAPGPEKECVSLMLVVGDTTATLTAEPTTSDPTSCMSVERRRIVPVRDRSPIVRTLGGGAAAQPSPTAPATPPGKTCHAMPHAGGKLDRAALEARVREAKGTTSCVGAAAGATPAVLWSDLAPALEALVVSAGAASLTLAVPEATTPQCPTSK